tara:strand:- start:196 stop:420 length:225 start_codon:yes stop_codon:yes gene_type:complete
MKFTRLFELPDNEQVLVRLVFEETYELKITSDFGGFAMSVAAGYETEDEAKNALESFTLEKAIAVRGDLEKLLG